MTASASLPIADWVLEKQLSIDLPEGWATMTLENACAKITDGTHKTPVYQEKGIPFISTANLVPFRKNFDFTGYSRFILRREHDELAKRCRPEKGDILISKCGTIGRSKEVEVDYEFSIFVGLALLKPHRGLFASRFLEVFLNGPYLKAKFEELSPGSTRRTLTLTAIKTVEIPVPPLAEQKRIVEQVEQLLVRVNAARERLARVPIILKRFRQAVLAAACSGRLTADWREEQNLLPAEPRMPTGWRIISLKDLAAKVQDGNYGALYPKANEWTSRGVAFIVPAAIASDGTVDLNKIRFISPERNAELKKAQLTEDDVIFPNRGSRDAQLRGYEPFAISVPKSLLPANINPQLTLVRPLPEMLVSGYLRIALNSEFFLSQVREATGGSALTFINLTETKGLQIPLPPLPEQREIVRRMEALLKLADSIEKRVSAATARAEKLTQAILAKAFRGELVPTEAELARREGRDYEPASALLARIRAERESNGTAPREKLRQRKITKRTRRSSSKS